MAELSLHLFEHVVPDVPLRQFVLTLPMSLRILVARDKRLLAAVRTVFLRAVKSFICKKTRESYPRKSLFPAGFCVVQRSGSALNLAPHFHAVLFDGAYHKDDDGQLRFVAAPAVLAAERLKLVTAVASRVERLLERRGLCKNGQWTDAQSEADPMLQLSLEAMKVPSSGQRREPEPQANASAVRGFNLHCQTRISAHDEAARIRLFRYVLRPAIAQERLHFEDGVVTFEMKRAFSDGSRVLTFTPEKFIRRIALLIPAPRQHEVTYIGLLAANAKHRNDIVRVPTHRRKAKPKSPATIEPALLPNGTTDDEPPSSRMKWSELIRKTFSTDVLHCCQCGGRARVIAAITEPAVIEKILAHLGITRDGEPKSARAPPRQLPLFDTVPL